MKKAHKISFYKLMTAGYISADTYRMLFPKQYFYELTIYDCNEYEGNSRSELEKLFNDDQTQQSVEFLEKIETDITKNNKFPFAILEKCLSNNEGVIEVIERIGKRTFLLDYVYCTSESLTSRNYINEDNINQIKQLIHSFRSIYQGLGNVLDLSPQELELLNSIQPSELIDEKEPINSGEGFLKGDVILIHEDALSAANAECRKYVLFLYSLDKDELEPIIDYFTTLLSKVSIRTYNAIKGVGFRNFLVNYLYADITKLLKIRNFGRKSLHDLDKIKSDILNYIDYKYECGDTFIVDNVIEQENQPKHIEFLTLRERLGDNQYNLLIKELQKLSESISVRSRNGIINYKGDFIEDFVNKDLDIKSINHIGRKSAKEIKIIVDKLRDLASTMEQREITAEEIDIIEKRSYYGDCFDDYVLNFYRENEYLPMFYMLDKLFKKVIEKKRDFRIFNLYTPIFIEEDYYSLDEIAAFLYLSRERVRQIYYKIYRQLYNPPEGKIDSKSITIWKILLNYQDWQYVRDSFLNSSHIEISILRDIASKESHSFTDHFLLLVVSIIAKDSYTLIGKDPIQHRTRTKQKWNSSYLIKKEFVDKFNFDGIFQIIEEYEESNREDYVATVNDMLLDFFYDAWKEFDSDLVFEITDIVTFILIQEFGLIPDDNYCFTIEGRKEENVADILYELLQSNGDPMSLDELYLNIDAKYPGKYKSPASIRIIVMRDPRLCSVGVNNLIGLLEWDHIKIGSIRDIIVQYLNNYEDPQHISQIVKYVQRYRDTSENSIRSTMISGNQFVQFSGGLYGLKDKQYSKVFYLDENDRYFEQRIHELELFLQENKHFPFMPSTPVEESLYRWWNRIKRSTTTLKDRQKSEVARILSVYKMLPTSKRNSEWFDNCHAFFDFVRINGRKPSRHSLNEKNLFAWFDKATKDFSEGSLNSQQEKAFLELCKSL